MNIYIYIYESCCFLSLPISGFEGRPISVAYGERLLAPSPLHFGDILIIAPRESLVYFWNLRLIISPEECLVFLGSYWAFKGILPR